MQKLLETMECLVRLLSFRKYINAVDRAGLNKRLLDELDKLPNVKLIFDHKLTGADFKKKLAWFEQREDKPRTDHAQNPTQDSSDEPARSKEIEVKFDLMLGCDGAHSAVRYHLMKYTRMNYTQEYIDTLWCEFHIEPSKFTGYDGFRISPNHLHIWPGKEFMFIAIPSLDKSFTCTLFMPATHFATLDEDTSSVPAFFRKNFPGVADRLISSKDLISQYTTNPHLPLITTKCAPHHYGAAAVILGDSAHAMVPFYGQGMNAGLEDVRVLFEHLDSAPNTSESARAEALSAYSTQRTPDASSICDLALRNYREMRADVTSPLYRLRKSIEEKLSIWFPSSGFKTQYSRVSFGNERYSEIERLTQGQWRTLQAGMVGFVGVLASAAGYGIWAWWRWERATRASKGIFKGSVRLAALTERIGRAFT